MEMRIMLWSGLGAAVLFLTIGGAWILSLPAAPAALVAPPITREEADAMIAALKPPKRERPLIAIIGANKGTEASDYLMPYGIVRRADVADVVALATEPGPVTLYPALKVEPQATVGDFDARNPEGADYVIVSAMSRATTTRRSCNGSRAKWPRARSSSASVPEPRSSAKQGCSTASGRRPIGTFSRNCATSIRR
jgi:hypothetical protein